MKTSQLLLVAIALMGVVRAVPLDPTEGDGDIRITREEAEMIHPFTAEDLYNAPADENTLVFYVDDDNMTLPDGFDEFDGSGVQKRSIPVGRTKQDCETGPPTGAANYSLLKKLAQVYSSQAHAHTYRYGHGCKQGARLVNKKKKQGACLSICIQTNKDYGIPNSRIGAVAADIAVGCHKGSSSTVQGIDYFNAYTMGAHGCANV